MIISWKDPNQLFTEVRAKKLKELHTLTHIKPPTQKAKDIMELLGAMKGTKKKDKIP